MSSLVISNLQNSQQPNNSFLRELTDKEGKALMGGGSYPEYLKTLQNRQSGSSTEENATLELKGTGIEELGLKTNKFDIYSLIKDLLPM